MGFTWAITLESVIEKTEELDHLYLLIEKRRAHLLDEEGDDLLEAEILEKVIDPVLTDLENYLKERLTPGTPYSEAKSLVHDWIEEQIASLA